jgi:hypothetical protein
MKTKLTATVILMLLLVPAAFGQSATTPRAATPDQQDSARAPQATPTPTARGPEYVEEKGFKTKILEIKYRDPNSLVRVVSNLGSGFRGAGIGANSDFKTLTIRDFPENIAVIEEAVKRLDTPLAARPDIEFHVHIIIASNTPTSTEELPAELTDVVRQLQGTLKYKSYGVMASSVHRTAEGGQGVSSNGIAESKLFNVSTPGGNPIFYQYGLAPITIRDIAGSTAIEIGRFQFSMRIPLNLGGAAQIQYENVGFNTPVTARESEKVVVGTTTMGDKGLIVVVTAKILKK